MRLLPRNPKQKQGSGSEGASAESQGVQVSGHCRSKAAGNHRATAGQLKPNTSAHSAKRPWLTDEFDKAARAQLVRRNNISKLGLDEGCFMELLINDPGQRWMD